MLINNDFSDDSFAGRLARIRRAMQEAHVGAFLVPVADEYQGEYPPPSARRLEWLTGFTGSAGLVAVTQDNAALFVDGRYTVQARQQVDMRHYEQKDLMRDSVAVWVGDHVAAGGALGFDPWLHTQASVKDLREKLEKENITLLPCFPNLIDTIWEDRPAVPCEPVETYPEAYAGESAADKRARIAETLKEKGIAAAIIAAPDSINWLLNIRGGDVRHTPLALGYALLEDNGAVRLFMDAAKISDAVRQHLGAEVHITPLDELAKAFTALKGKKVLYDARRAASWFHAALTQAGAEVVEGDDPCLLPKDCKNATEIQGMRNAHIRDGVALTRFLYWLDKTVAMREVTELEAERKLLAFRKEQPLFREPSFDTIAGSGAHGAIVHYRATEASNAVLEPNSLFLLDSGGQYLDGTTDVTRTVAVGAPTEEQKRRFTQVLKGHIALGNCVFPKGIAGHHLDVLARRALWHEGLDYAHGTGHGVGAFLCVHEGPQSISLRSGVPLEPGMVVSNEPGFSKEGEYGMRIESLVVVCEKEGFGGGDRPFYGFETLTLAPIDRNLILPELLTVEEKAWLNAYHAHVYATLSGLLSAEEREWLEGKTRAV